MDIFYADSVEHGVPFFCGKELSVFSANIFSVVVFTAYFQIGIYLPQGNIYMAIRNLRSGGDSIVQDIPQNGNEVKVADKNGGKGTYCGKSNVFLAADIGFGI